MLVNSPDNVPLTPGYPDFRRRRFIEFGRGARGWRGFFSSLPTFITRIITRGDDFRQIFVLLIYKKSSRVPSILSVLQFVTRRRFLPSEFIIFQPPQSRAGTIVARSRGREISKSGRRGGGGAPAQ